MGTYREESRKDWSRRFGEATSVEDIQIGCLQRIADSVEAMSKNYQSLINDRDWYKRQYEAREKDNARMARRIAAYQGVIKRMKKRP